MWSAETNPHEVAVERSEGEGILTTVGGGSLSMFIASLLVTARRSHSPGGQHSEWPLQVHGGLEAAGCNATSKQLNPTGTDLNPAPEWIGLTALYLHSHQAR